MWLLRFQIEILILITSIQAEPSMYPINEDWDIISDDDVHQAENYTAHPHHAPQARQFHFEFNLGWQTCAPTSPRTEDMPPQERQTIPMPNFSNAVQQEQSPLYNLPAEIRWCIYELVLRSPEPETPVVFRHRDKSQIDQLSVLSILEVCHRSLFEAGSIFYTRNELSIDLRQSRNAVASFLASIGPKRRAIITSLTVVAHSASNLLTALRDLRSAPNLRNLCVRRPLSVRFTNASSWVLLASQLKVELDGLESMEQIRFVYPEVEVMDDHEIERLRILNEVEETLQNVITRRRGKF
jgi:hypothetical protein